MLQRVKLAWWARLLRAGPARFQERAARELVRLGPPAVPALIRCIWADYLASRRLAVEAISQIGDERSAAPLGAELQGLGKSTRSNLHCALAASAFVEALGRLGAAGAIPVLVQVLRDDADYREQANAAPSIRAGVIEALVQIARRVGAPGVVEPLAAALCKPLYGYGTESLIKAVAGPLDRIDPDWRRSAPAARIVDWSLAALREGRDQEQARRLLALVNDARAIPPLVALLREEWKSNKVWGLADLLKQLGWQPDDLGDRVLLAVAGAKWDEAVALGAAAVKPLAEKWEGPQYGVYVYDALFRIDDPHAVQPFTELALGDGRLGAPAVEKIRKLLESHAALIPTEHLRRVASLEGVGQFRYLAVEWEWDGNNDRWSDVATRYDYSRVERTEEVDCARVRELARQELLRREGEAGGRGDQA